MSSSLDRAPVRLAVLGASGRLGRRVVACVPDTLRLVAACVGEQSASLGLDAGLLAGVAALDLPLVALSAVDWTQVDVVVDVSLPEATPTLAAAVREVPKAQRPAVVSGVTGLGEAGRAALAELAEGTAVLHTRNFSAGVAVLADLAARAARALPDADVEIVEAHHRHKLDAPSGTALWLAEAIADARGRPVRVLHGRQGAVGRGDEDVSTHTVIGVHAVRGGDVVGEHTVWLCSPGERVQLGHVATTRDTFAHGALRCAAWLAGRSPGTYSVRQVLSLDPLYT